MMFVAMNSNKRHAVMVVLDFRAGLNIAYIIRKIYEIDKNEKGYFGLNNTIWNL